MWHVVKDVQEKRVTANFYTDGWPNFTTVISQAFSPRLSEVAKWIRSCLCLLLEVFSLQIYDLKQVTGKYCFSF